MHKSWCQREQQTQHKNWCQRELQNNVKELMQRELRNMQKNWRQRELQANRPTSDCFSSHISASCRGFDCTCLVKTTRQQRNAALKGLPRCTHQGYDSEDLMRPITCETWNKQNQQAKPTQMMQTTVCYWCFSSESHMNLIWISSEVIWMSRFATTFLRHVL